MFARYMGEKGVAAKDLKPFSVDDPTGAKHRRSLDSKFHRPDRFRRQGAGHSNRQTEQSENRSSGSATALSARMRQERAAARSKREGEARASRTKSGGCLSKLLVIGILVGGMNAIYPVARDLYDQIELRELGSPATGELTSIRKLPFTIEDDSLYALTVQVSIDGYEPYSVKLKQILSVDEASQLTVGSTVALRYDPYDLDKVVLVDRTGASTFGDPKPARNDQASPAAADPTSRPSAKQASPSTASRPEPANTNEPTFPVTDVLGGSTPPSSQGKTGAPNSRTSPSQSSPACDLARSCCQKLQERIGGNQGNCSAYRPIGGKDNHCVQSLSAFRKAGRSLGLRCQ